MTLAPLSEENISEIFEKYEETDFEVAAPTFSWHFTLAIPSKQLEFIHPMLTEHKKLENSKPKVYISQLT